MCHAVLLPASQASRPCCCFLLLRLLLPLLLRVSHQQWLVVTATAATMAASKPVTSADGMNTDHSPLQPVCLNCWRGDWR
jgi:hypothetical protein